MKTLLIVFVLIGLNSFSQFQKPTEVSTRTPYFERKVVVGFAVNNSWSCYSDLLKDSAFFRPSLGFHIKTNYFFKPYIGISLGAGLQQRGMGIYTPDLDNSIGNPDSTGRLRYRTTTIDLPVQLILRSPKDIFPGTRLSMGLGVNFSYIYKAQRIWKSVDDGFHQPSNITANYDKLDIPIRINVGFDIDAGPGCLFRLHLVGEMGNKFIYTNPTTQIKSNKNILFGIDLSFLF